MLGMPGHNIKVWPVRPKRGQGHGLRAHKYPAAQLFPSAGRKKPQKLIILKEKEENQRKGRKEGRESRRREKEEKVFHYSLIQINKCRRNDRNINTTKGCF